MNVELGTVSRWLNFPFARYGEKDKSRWFVCVGFSGPFAQAPQIYLCTTTTYLESFQGSGHRSGHRHFVFKGMPHSCFDSDCAIDFDEKPYVIQQEVLSKFNTDLEFKGKLDENTLRMIYKRLLLCKHLSFMELSDIHDSYNRAEITGLKKPRRPN